MTPEQVADRDSVWKRMAEEHPEFIRAFDYTDNYHTVREIVLGGSMTWQKANELFKPFPGARVMDVGANVGIYTAFCAANGARVRAYEPFDVLYNQTRNMLGWTGILDRVEFINAAVWVHTGECGYSGNISSMENCVWYNGSVPVAGINPTEFKHKGMTKCVSFAEAIGDEQWDCVKLDIEGAEFEVLLATPAAVLQRIKFAYVEFHPWASQELYDATIAKLHEVFNFTGYFQNNLGRWEVGYCQRR